MKELEINGEKLSQVRMKQPPYHPGTLVSLSYPKSQIDYNFDDDALTVHIPAFLSVELYRKGALPLTDSAKDSPFDIKESGKKKGTYILEDVIYPHTSGKNKVQFIFTRFKN